VRCGAFVRAAPAEPFPRTSNIATARLRSRQLGEADGPARLATRALRASGNSAARRWTVPRACSHAFARCVRLASADSALSMLLPSVAQRVRRTQCDGAAFGCRRLVRAVATSGSAVSSWPSLRESAAFGLCRAGTGRAVPGFAAEPAAPVNPVQAGRGSLRLGRLRPYPRRRRLDLPRPWPLSLSLRPVVRGFVLMGLLWLRLMRPLGCRRHPGLCQPGGSRLSRP